MLKFGYHRNFYFIYNSIEQCVNNKFKELCRYYWRLQKELHIHIETNFFEAAGQLSYIAGSIDIALHSVHNWYKHQYATSHITTCSRSSSSSPSWRELYHNYHNPVCVSPPHSSMLLSSLKCTDSLISGAEFLRWRLTPIGMASASICKEKDKLSEVSSIALV